MPVLNGYMGKTRTYQEGLKQLRAAFITVETTSKMIFICKTKPVS